MQHAKLALFRQQQERNVVRVQPMLAMRDERPKRVLRDQVVQRVGARFFKMGGNVHGDSGSDRAIE
jgi:hypothetical protein